MYDMSRVMTYGYFDAVGPDERYAQRQKLNAQRTPFDKIDAFFQANLK